MRLFSHNRQLAASAADHGRSRGRRSPYISDRQNNGDEEPDKQNNGDGPSSPQFSVEAFAHMLDTCRKSRNRAQVLHLFECMPQRMVVDHAQIANQLAALLLEAGSIHHAKHVFDRLLHRDAHTWSSFIIGYVRYGEWRHALTLFQIMQRETSLCLSDYAFVSLLKACIRLKDMESGSKLHTIIAKGGLLKANLYIGSALVDMYIKCGSLSKAQEVFYELPNRDIVLWTTLVAGYVDHGRAEEALQFVKQMESDGFAPNQHTLVCSSKACGVLKATSRGQEIHTEITMKGFDCEIIVGNSLLNMYTTCGLLETAKVLLHKLPVRDVVSWTVMIDGYAEHGYGDEALNCLEHMQRESIPSNALTLACSVKACCNIGAIEKGYELHSAIIEAGFEGELRVGSTLVSMYVESGMLAEAQFVFDMLPIRDSILWSSLIAGYSQIGESRYVFSTFDKMLGECMKPVSGTFVIVLNACNHEGLVEEAFAFLDAILNHYGLAPTLEHYTTMVDLLGRSGNLGKAVSMIEGIRCHPDYVLWCTVLRACQNRGNLKLARHAFENAVELNNRGMTAYVCMGNIYAEATIYDEASEVHE